MTSTAIGGENAGGMGKKLKKERKRNWRKCVRDEDTKIQYPR